MKKKTKERIQEEIEIVKRNFDNTEEVLKEICILTEHTTVIFHLKEFSMFVDFIKWGKYGKEFSDDGFQKQYGQYGESENDLAEDSLFNWACLYYIYYLHRWDLEGVKISKIKPEMLREYAINQDKELDKIYDLIKEHEWNKLYKLYEDRCVFNERETIFSGNDRSQ